MTKQEFFNEFSKIVNKYHFTISEGHIRGNIHETCILCPITALYLEKYDIYIDTEGVNSAAAKLGLNTTDRRDIASAADYTSKDSIRKQLEKIIAKSVD